MIQSPCKSLYVTNKYMVNKDGRVEGWKDEKNPEKENGRVDIPFAPLGLRVEGWKDGRMEELALHPSTLPSFQSFATSVSTSYALQ